MKTELCIKWFPDFALALVDKSFFLGKFSDILIQEDKANTVSAAAEISLWEAQAIPTWNHNCSDDELERVLLMNHCEFGIEPAAVACQS